MEAVSDLAGLAGHAVAWNALALEAPQRQPDLSHAWVASFLETRRDPEDPFRVLFAYDQDRLVGVLPYVRRPSPRLGRLAPVLHLPHHPDHTRAGDALLAAGREREAFETLVGAAFRTEPRRFAMRFSGVREGSSTWKALEGGTSLGVLERLEEPPGSYVRIQGTMDEFRAGLGDNFRRNLRKSGNRLGREPGVAIRLLGGKEADPAELDRFLALEASGWKGREGTAIAADPTLAPFVRALVGRLAAVGWLEWHFLEIGGRIAAGHLGARFGKSLVLLKIAYDEAFSRLGPGSLLFERVVEREFLGGTTVEINCTTDMPWHRNWGLPQATHAGLLLFPKRPWPLLAGVAPTRLRARAKRVPLLRAIARRLQGEPPLTPAAPAAAVAAEDAPS